MKVETQSEDTYSYNSDREDLPDLLGHTRSVELPAQINRSLLLAK